MKKLAAVVTIAALLTLAPAASAHVLSQPRAENRAEIESYDFADFGEQYGWDCPRRTSAHSFRCIIASYDSASDITCDAYVNVRYTSRTRRGTVAGALTEIDCGDGNPYDL